MGAHHTKDKGDLGVAKAHADLAAKGWTVLFPSTEHAPFDLGTKHVPVDKRAIDLLCVYCPETDTCYHLDPLQHRVSVTIRVTPSRNNQSVGVLDATKCRAVPV